LYLHPELNRENLGAIREFKSLMFVFAPVSDPLIRVTAFNLHPGATTALTNTAHANVVKPVPGYPSNKALAKSRCEKCKAKPAADNIPTVIIAGRI
jgi:hypothetical protein